MCIETMFLSVFNGRKPVPYSKKVKYQLEMYTAATNAVRKGGSNYPHSPKKSPKTPTPRPYRVRTGEEGEY